MTDISAEAVAALAAPLGFRIEGREIVDSQGHRGRLAGATVHIDQSWTRPSIWARLFTPIKQQGQLTSRATLVVMVECVYGVVLIERVGVDHEVTARRFAHALHLAYP